MKSEPKISTGGDFESTNQSNWSIHFLNSFFTGYLCNWWTDFISERNFDAVESDSYRNETLKGI